MSIRPIETPLPPPATGGPARQAGEPRIAPVATEQRGAAALVRLAGEVPSQDRAPRSPSAQTAEAPDASKEREALLVAVERAQKVVETQVRDMSFSVHEKTGQLIVQIIDRESKEVIRQMPAEEMLRIAEQILAMQGENQPGLLLRQQA